MKKTLYTFLAIAIIFSACKKEEEINGCTNQNATNYNANATDDPDDSCIYDIIGKWDATDVVVDTNRTIKVFGITIDSLSGSGTIIGTPEDSETPTALEFSSDGTVSVEFSYNNETDNANYIVNGNILTVEDQCDEDMSFMYTVGEDGLSLISANVFDTTWVEEGVTIEMSYSISMSINFIRDNSTLTNNTSQLRKASNPWIRKSKINNILKSIK